MIKRELLDCVASCSVLNIIIVKRTSNIENKIVHINVGATYIMKYRYINNNILPHLISIIQITLLLS
jgi:hypothetical protein